MSSISIGSHTATKRQTVNNGSPRDNHNATITTTNSTNHRQTQIITTKITQISPSNTKTSNDLEEQNSKEEVYVRSQSNPTPDFLADLVQLSDQPHASKTKKNECFPLSPSKGKKNQGEENDEDDSNSASQMFLNHVSTSTTSGCKKETSTAHSGGSTGGDISGTRTTTTTRETDKNSSNSLLLNNKAENNTIFANKANSKEMSVEDVEQSQKMSAPIFGDQFQYNSQNNYHFQSSEQQSKQQPTSSQQSTTTNNFMPFLAYAADNNRQQLPPPTSTFDRPNLTSNATTTSQTNFNPQQMQMPANGSKFQPQNDQNQSFQQVQAQDHHTAPQMNFQIYEQRRLWSRHTIAGPRGAEFDESKPKSNFQSLMPFGEAQLNSQSFIPSHSSNSSSFALNNHNVVSSASGGVNGIGAGRSQSSYMQRPSPNSINQFWPTAPSTAQNQPQHLNLVGQGNSPFNDNDAGGTSSGQSNQQTFDFSQQQMSSHQHQSLVASQIQQKSPPTSHQLPQMLANNQIVVTVIPCGSEEGPSTSLSNLQAGVSATNQTTTAAELPYELTLNKMSADQNNLKEIFLKDRPSWENIFSHHLASESQPNFSVYRVVYDTDMSSRGDPEFSLHILYMKSTEKTLTRNYNAQELELFCHNRFYGPLVVALNQYKSPYDLVSFTLEDLHQVQILNRNYQHKSIKDDFVPGCLLKFSYLNKNLNDILAREERYVFFMFYYKTSWCPTKKDSHDSKSCVFAHHTRDFRRPPDLFRYVPEDCETLIGNMGWDQCPLGLKCPKCHSTVERLYHPDKYKHVQCDKSRCNKLDICAFYHKPTENKLARKLRDQHNQARLGIKKPNIDQLSEELKHFYKLEHEKEVMQAEQNQQQNCLNQSTPAHLITFDQPILQQHHAGSEDQSHHQQHHHLQQNQLATNFSTLTLNRSIPPNLSTMQPPPNHASLPQMPRPTANSSLSVNSRDHQSSALQIGQIDSNLINARSFVPTNHQQNQIPPQSSCMPPFQHQINQGGLLQPLNSTSSFQPGQQNQQAPIQSQQNAEAQAQQQIWGSRRSLDTDGATIGSQGSSSVQQQTTQHQSDDFFNRQRGVSQSQHVPQAMRPAVSSNYTPLVPQRNGSQEFVPYPPQMLNNQSNNLALQQLGLGGGCQPCHHQPSANSPNSPTINEQFNLDLFACNQANTTTNSAQNTQQQASYHLARRQVSGSEYQTRSSKFADIFASFRPAAIQTNEHRPTSGNTPLHHFKQQSINQDPKSNELTQISQGRQQQLVEGGIQGQGQGLSARHSEGAAFGNSLFLMRENSQDVANHQTNTTIPSQSGPADPHHQSTCRILAANGGDQRTNIVYEDDPWSPSKVGALNEDTMPDNIAAVLIDEDEEAFVPIGGGRSAAQRKKAKSEYHQRPSACAAAAGSAPSQNNISSPTLQMPTFAQCFYQQPPPALLGHQNNFGAGSSEIATNSQNERHNDKMNNAESVEKKVIMDESAQNLIQQSEQQPNPEFAANPISSQKQRLQASSSNKLTKNQATHASSKEIQNNLDTIREVESSNLGQSFPSSGAFVQDALLQHSSIQPGLNGNNTTTSCAYDDNETPFGANHRCSYDASDPTTSTNANANTNNNIGGAQQISNQNAQFKSQPEL